MQLPPIITTDNRHSSFDVVEKYLGHVFDFIEVENFTWVSGKKEESLHHHVCLVVSGDLLDDNNHEKPQHNFLFGFSNDAVSRVMNSMGQSCTPEQKKHLEVISQDSPCFFAHNGFGGLENHNCEDPNETWHSSLRTETKAGVCSTKS